jgi:hypothetical protein
MKFSGEVKYSLVQILWDDAYAYYGSTWLNIDSEEYMEIKNARMSTVGHFLGYSEETDAIHIARGWDLKDEVEGIFIIPLGMTKDVIFLEPKKEIKKKKKK